MVSSDILYEVLYQIYNTNYVESEKCRKKTTLLILTVAYYNTVKNFLTAVTL